MNKLVASSNPILSDKLVQVWEHSRKVAAISYVLALRLPHLSADQAMLAGLMHDIGVIPLCIHIEKIRAPIDIEALETLINNCHATIGTKLLKQWNFSHEIVSVVAAHEDIHRLSNNAPLADYADVVTFANLQDSARAKIVVWDNVAAVKRIGLSEEECKMFLENNAERIEMVEILLGMKQRSKPAISSSPQRPPATVTPPPTAHPANEKSGLFSFFSRLRK
jgi:putative nucleotidyltransferase with HDIG domain